MNLPYQQQPLSLSQFILRAIVVAITIMVAVLVILNFYTRGQLQTQYHSTIAQEISARSQAIHDMVEFRYREISFLHSTPPIQGIVRATQNGGIDPFDGTTLDQWYERLEIIFDSYLATHPHVTQARYIKIDSSGNEIVRIERQDNKILARRGIRLQGKSNEQYYKDIARLAPGDIYFSDINLNREFGKIEFPYWPTFRVAKPVFHENSEIFGFVVLNYDGRSWLPDLVSNLDSSLEVYLLNSKGGYLLHPNPEKSFEFEFDKNVVWSEEFSAANEKNSFGDLKVATTQNGSQLYYLEHIIPISDRTQGRLLRLIVGVPSTIIDSTITNNRIMAAGVLLVTTVIFLFFLAYYQNQINRKLILIRNAAEFKAIFDSSNDAIISVDADGNIKSWSNGAETMFGYSHNSALNRNIFDLIFKNGAEFLKPHTLHTVFHNKKIEIIETSAIPQRGNSINVSATLSPIVLKEDGRTAGVALIIRDITVQKAIEAQIHNVNIELEQRVAERTRELESARNEAMQASRSKSEFIANVSHEIRTPMNGVLGTLKLLRREHLNHKQSRLVNLAEKSANALTNLINDILDLSKIEAGKLDLESLEFNLLPLIEDTSASLSIAAYDKGLEMVVDISGVKVESAIGDPNRIRQVLVNIMSNALKFTEAGTISVSAWTEPGDKEGETLFTCSVADTGIGISEEKIDGLFESFSQEDNSVTRRFGGTGLGLTISKQLCEMMGGTIAVHSEKNKGSEFIFKIKLGVSSANINSQPIPWSGQVRCLLICSHHSLSAAVIQQLRLWSIAVSHVNSSLECLRITSSCNRWDFAIIDNRLNDGLGISLAGELVNTLKFYAGQILLLSPPTSDIAQNCGYRVVTKPVLPRELCRKVAVALNLNEETEEFIKQTTGDSPQFNNQCTILIVDDNAINLEVASGFLNDMGLKILQADSGTEALRILSKGKVDLIFMDCQMPEMDGYATTNAIRCNEAGNNAETPIIAMTANAMAGAREQCLAAGMDDYLTKPLDPDQVQQKLVKYLKEYQTSPQDCEDKKHTESTQESATNRVWDRTGLRRRLNDRTDRMIQLVQMFLNNLPKSCDELHDAYSRSQNDSNPSKASLQAAKEAAHKIKGSAGNLGALELAEICSNLEKGVGGVEKQALLDRFDDAVNSIMSEMMAFLRSNGSENTAGTLPSNNTKH